MSTYSRILIAIAALAISATYFLPLWQISLDAPQYPEGLGLHIWINKMTGQNQGDLDKINNLNHYIGMKKIHPDSIKELKVMPWVMRGVLLFGLFAALLGKRGWLIAWLLLFVALSCVGLADYYAWGYDYGHNLDSEHAIIKIPGMNYQPPLIGSKKLLNFTASSWPASGGMVAIGSFLLGLFVLGFEIKRKRILLQRSKTLITTILVLSCMLGCGTSTPIPIQYGQDTCDYCSMTIVNAQFGSELVTKKHKVYKFDSIECLAAFSVKNSDRLGGAQGWVTNQEKSDKFLSVQKAVIIAAESLHSPMGVGLVSVSSESEAERIIKSYGGRIVSWPEVETLVSNKWKVTPEK